MASLTIITQPTFEPITLEEARAHLRVTSSDDDALIVGYMLAARQHVEDYLGRSLITRTLEVTIDDGLPCEIELPRPPLASVTFVTYVDTAGATQTLSAGLYQVVTGMVGGKIVPAYGASWPSTRCQSDAVTVRYVAGYGANSTSVPDAIRMAILLLVGHFYANREAAMVGVSVSELPFAVEALLNPYRAYF